MFELTVNTGDSSGQGQHTKPGTGHPLINKQDLQIHLQDMLGSHSPEGNNEVKMELLPSLVCTVRGLKVDDSAADEEKMVHAFRARPVLLFTDLKRQLPRPIISYVTVTVPVMNRLQQCR